MKAICVGAIVALSLVVAAQGAILHRMADAVAELRDAASDLEMSVVLLQREYADLRLSRESELLENAGK